VSTSPPFGAVTMIHDPAGVGVAEGMTGVGVLVGVFVFVGVRLGFMDTGAAAAGEYNTANMGMAIKSIRLNGKSFLNINGLLYMNVHNGLQVPDYTRRAAISFIKEESSGKITPLCQTNLSSFTP
jgi:hypothetical protein